MNTDVPRQWKGWHDNMPGNDPPSDITPGEMWRALTSLGRLIETVQTRLDELPRQVSAEIESRAAERHAGLVGRVDHLDDVVLLEHDRLSGVVTEVARLRDLVSTLRLLVYGAVGLILTAVVGALVAVVVHTT